MQRTAVIKQFKEIGSVDGLIDGKRRLIVEKDRLDVKLRNIEIEYQDTKIVVQNIKIDYEDTGIENI